MSCDQTEGKFEKRKGMKKMGTYGLVHLDHFGLHLVLWSTSSLGQLLLDSCVRLVPFHLGGQVIADVHLAMIMIFHLELGKT